MKTRLSYDTKLIVKCENDDICADCPNALSQGCNLDSIGNRIAERDKLISEKLLTDENEIVYYGEMLQKTVDNTDEEFFMKVCGKCRWYKAGFCTYESWKESAEQFLLM